MHTAYFDIDCGKMGKPTFRVDYKEVDGGIIIEEVCIIKEIHTANGGKLTVADHVLRTITDEFEQYIIGLIRGEI